MTADAAAVAAYPRSAVVVLLDSLNRHLLGAYGSTEFATPNLDRFARRAVRFTRHYTGSLPCMPARHDILCGALDFLWRPWGSVEVWEAALPAYLREAGVVTKLVSDHPHLFETGGENYHTDFTAWDYQRGHEGDPWQTRADPSWMGTPTFGKASAFYDRSRGYFRGEDDFPGPRTMAAAARWLEASAPAHDRFLLFVDEFDPHEPFDTPEPYASMYDEDWRGPHLIWPPYVDAAQSATLLDDAQGRQIRACYGGKLTMIDAWFGRLLDVLDATGRWDDTAVIVVTDHGHYLGERGGIWGKPPVPLFDEMSHIPLLVAWPGVAPGERDCLSTGVDVFATLADLFGVTPRHRTHGRSLVPALHDPSYAVRPWALSGIWGREVTVVDAERKYCRAPAGPNAPLSMWSNRWSTMPLPHIGRDAALPPPDKRAYLDRMPGTEVPVIRQPYQPGDLLPYWTGGEFHGTHLYDVDADPGETRNRAGEAWEGEAADLLRAALEDVEAPDDQYARLGLA